MKGYDLFQQLPTTSIEKKNKLTKSKIRKYLCTLSYMHIYMYIHMYVNMYVIFVAVAIA